MTDVLLVSLGTTGGLRAADEAFAASLERAGATVAIARAAAVRDVRTLALTDLVQARAARAAVRDARAVVYSTTTASLLAPRAGAIRFDAAAAGNRPGRHGVWQRPVERRRFADAPLLLPWSEGALAEAPRVDTPAVVVPPPIPAPAVAGARDVAAVTYGAHPEKKGLDRVLAAWRAVRRDDEELVVGGIEREGEPGVRYAGTLAPDAWSALLASARVFVTAPRREDFGIAQLEALAAGCVLVTTPSPGPYAALPLARELDPRCVSDDLGPALRAALDDPRPGYASGAQRLLRPFGTEAVDRIVAEDVLPRLL